jgi:hypothetical protein
MPSWSIATSLASQPLSADIGLYGRALIHSAEKNTTRQSFAFLLVPNQDLKYLNFSLGQVYLEKGETALRATSSCASFQSSNLREAVPALATMYPGSGRFEDLRLLSQGTETENISELLTGVAWPITCRIS